MDDDERPVVLVVNRDARTRERVGAWLEAAGMEVMGCPGPSRPDYACIGADRGRCALGRSADLVVLDAWLQSDAAMRGARATTLARLYASWGTPVVLMTDRRDAPVDRIEDIALATVDWPPDRRELVETVHAIAARPWAATSGTEGR
jgi:DNA-binding response OmpR family regulator